MNREHFLQKANQIMQLVKEQFDSVFSEKEPACLGCAAAAQRIRKPEHQHKNDEAANRMLLELLERKKCTPHS